jgi:trehalose 6-phosphate phosphatase
LSIAATLVAVLHEKLQGALALVSGRTLDDLDGLFAPLRLPAAGAYGAEWRLTAEAPVEKGVLLLAVALHYRQAPHLRDDLDAALTGILEPFRDSLRLIRGRMVFEVARIACDKGGAIDRFLEQGAFKGRRPVFVGDDETDYAAMDACLRHGGVATRVGSAETAAAQHFNAPAGVRAWITRQTRAGRPFSPAPGRECRV